MRIALVYIFVFIALKSVNAQSIVKDFSPQIVLDPSRYYHYSEHSRRFTGIPSVAIAESGTIWATWYSGVTPEEDANNYVVLACSIDGGNTWEEKLVVDPDGRGPLRAFDPEIWISPDKRVWLFWSQKEGIIDGTEPKLWAMVIDVDGLGKISFQQPALIADGVMMCKPTVLSNGDWLLPVSTWRHTDGSARVVVSADEGNSWQVRGACHVPATDRDFDEHMVIERQDASLWMLVRTKYGIGESVSKDGGKTWSALESSGIMHPSSRFFIGRLASGNLLLVKHGPMKVKTGRSHLMAFISKDDGRSWSKGLLLDERSGISYPDGQQTSDGLIYIIYDYDRRGQQEIVMTNFTEEHILTEEYDHSLVNIFKNRKVISKGGR